MKYKKKDLCYIESLYDKERFVEFCGVGMAGSNVMQHQKIQTKILLNYSRIFGENALTETRLSDEVRITPDISIWENTFGISQRDPQNPLLTIEITHSMRNDRYSDRTICATFELFPTIREAFIYNYADDVWTRYRCNEKGEVIKEVGCDYSQLLDIDLHTLLK